MEALRMAALSFNTEKRGRSSRRNSRARSRTRAEKSKWRRCEKHQVIRTKERRSEARERMMMEQEDSNSQRRRALEKIWEPRVLVPSPFVAAGN